jgi:signal transduction histidine kinase
VLVADNGLGIPPSRAERVFEPFYQVDGSPTRAHGARPRRRRSRGERRDHGGDESVRSRLFPDGSQARADRHARRRTVVCDRYTWTGTRLRLRWRRVSGRWWMRPEMHGPIQRACTGSDAPHGLG